MTVLPLKRAEGNLRLPDAASSSVPKASPDDPAVSVMTDFRNTGVFSIRQDVTVDEALLYMKTAGVRFLFVKDDEDRLSGLVTSTDIQGEKPLRHIRESGASRHDVQIRHIMVPVDQWEVSAYADVEKARISHVVDSFKAAGRRHLVVTEKNVVRGIFSATRVEQALGIRLEIVRTAKSFAEIESALLR